MAKAPKDLTELFVSSVNLSRPKKAGAATFEFTMSDEDIYGDVKYVLLTGNEPFDQFTGGFPFGRISEIFGLENCGKSALMIRSMCRFQAKHIYEVVDKKGFIYTLKRVDPRRIRLLKVYIDNEGSLEKGFKLGIHDVTFDENGVEKVEETMLENAGVGLCDTIEQVFLSMDKFLKIIRDAEKENEEDENDDLVFGVFIVDTVAGTSSKAEMEQAWDERDFPRAAGKISEGFRRLRAEISRHNVALICTNQVRTNYNNQSSGGFKIKYSTPQANDFSTYGGKALAFYATHRIFMFQVPVKYTLVKGAQFPAGFLVGLRTIKNRLRKPLREARMVLLFDEDQGGLHNIFSLLESLVFLRVAAFGKEDDDGGSAKGGCVRFLFRKHGIETTTFAENVKPEEESKPDAASHNRRKKKLEDPEIEDRWQWPAFFRAHRADLEKLWAAAVDKANTTEGLDAFYKGQGTGEDADPEEVPQPPRRRRSTIPVLEDTDV